MDGIIEHYGTWYPLQALPLQALSPFAEGENGAQEQVYAQRVVVGTCECGTFRESIQKDRVADRTCHRDLLCKPN